MRPLPTGFQRVDEKFTGPIGGRGCFHLTMRAPALVLATEDVESDVHHRLPRQLVRRRCSQNLRRVSEQCHAQ